MMTATHYRPTVTLIAAASLLGMIVFAGGCKNDEPVPYEEADVSRVLMHDEEQQDVFPQHQGEQALDLPDVLARVGDTEITSEEVMGQIDTMLARSGQPMDPQTKEMYRSMLLQQVVEGRIVRSLLQKATDEEGIEITEEEIDQTIAELVQSLPPGITLDDALARERINPVEFRDSLRLDVKINKLLEAKAADIAVPDEEAIRKFYEENQHFFERPETAKASHILVMIDEETDEETARQKIEDIRRQLLEGADFAELAMEHSACPSGREGGDLGAISRGQMVPPFDEAVFSQEIGKIGEVVLTQFGYHVIKVTDRQEAHIQSLEEVYGTIEQVQQQQKQQEAVQEYIEKLREGADVEIFIEMEDPPAGMMPPQGPR